MPESAMAARNENVMPMARQAISFIRIMRNTITPSCLFIESPINKFSFYSINRYVIENVRIENFTKFLYEKVQPNAI